MITFQTNPIFPTPSPMPTPNSRKTERKPVKTFLTASPYQKVEPSKAASTNGVRTLIANHSSAP
jgi:hypothetical protein